MRRLPAALALVLLLSACASTPPPAKGTGTARPSSGHSAHPPQISHPTPSADAFRPPKVMNAPGLEGVIGRNATALANLLGPPRLTVKEGDAQKLQFSGKACVLDIYLYPLRAGAEPTATHIEARRSSDGLAVDRGACVAALRR